MAGATSYDPPVLSSLNEETNLAVKSFQTLPDRWVLARVSAPAGGNVGHVADWDPGLGTIPAATNQSMAYGGLAYECGLIRVFQVGLNAGTEYRFCLLYTSDAADE